MTTVMRTFAASRPARFGRCLTAVTALASLALISACSKESESAEDEGVASVTEAGGTTSQAPVQVERPLIRPDTTEEEERRLGQLYQECQAQYGLAKYMLKNDNGSWKGYKGGNDKLWRAAEKACASKQPETLPERAAREDPEY
jgi:hypothetical protein